MNQWTHMELSESKGFGWDGRHMLYELTVDGWNDHDLFTDVQTLATIRLHMNPNTAERAFYIHFHHENIETNIRLMRIVDIGVDVLLTDSRMDLEDGIREEDPHFSQLDFDEEE